MVVIWTKFAFEDVHNIHEFVAESSKYYAGLVKDKFFSATRQLNRFPESGRIVPDNMLKDYRELLVYSYRIVYRITKKQIYIMAVVNMRQDIKAYKSFKKIRRKK